MQTTSHILMIRPVHFGYNHQTAVNNSFQVQGDPNGVHDKAVAEFDGFVKVLREAGINVIVVDDTIEPHTPDSIFPNNWISFHKNGTIVFYPMYADNRRLERKPSALEKIEEKYKVRNIINLSVYEEQGKFLEGTGSMVLDRDQRIAYACLSPRTDIEVFRQFCREMHYHAVSFRAVDSKGAPIYHTNVMMCVADRYVVICLDSIADGAEKAYVMATIINSGKMIIPITMEQMNRFAGNMLQVQTSAGEPLLVMSSQAFQSLNKDQIEKLQSFNRIIHAPLETIESNGGGSARCMMAEVHLPVKS